MYDLFNSSGINKWGDKSPINILVKKSCESKEYFIIELLRLFLSNSFIIYIINKWIIKNFLKLSEVMFSFLICFLRVNYIFNKWNKCMIYSIPPASMDAFLFKFSFKLTWWSDLINQS